MILRRLCYQPIKNGTALNICIENYKIHQNSIRYKSMFQWYNKLWKKFDDEKPEAPYNHCTQVGDPVLRMIASEVPKVRIRSDEIRHLIERMKKVLRNYNVLGISAPQIGVPYRIIVMEAPETLKEKYSDAIYKARQMEILPLTTVINPLLKVKNFNTKTFAEGCSSVCGFTGDVKRYEEVILSGLNEKGDAIEMNLKGWNARIAQHEVDHLNGQVFTDIMEKKSFTRAAWEAVNIHSGQLSIPFHPPKISPIKRRRRIIS